MKRPLLTTTRIWSRSPPLCRTKPEAERQEAQAAVAGSTFHWPRSNLRGFACRPPQSEGHSRDATPSRCSSCAAPAGSSSVPQQIPTSPLGHHQAIERADTARHGVGVGASTTGSTRITQVCCIKHARSSLLQCGRGGNTAV